MPIPTAAPRQGAALPLFSTQAPDKVSGLFHAGTILARLLEMGRALDAKLLRGALEEAFGASDAEGAWVWKDAYKAVEVAQILFLQKFGRAMAAQAAIGRASWGKSVSVRVDLGGRRIIKKKKEHITQH